MLKPQTEFQMVFLSSVLGSPYSTSIASSEKQLFPSFSYFIFRFFLLFFFLYLQFFFIFVLYFSFLLVFFFFFVLVTLEIGHADFRWWRIFAYIREYFILPTIFWFFSALKTFTDFTNKVLSFSKSKSWV